MSSLILKTGARIMFPVILSFSLFILARGHVSPGGGFVGGLVAAAAYVMYALAFSVADTRRVLWSLDPRKLIATGLLIAWASAVYSLFLGQPFMTGVLGHFNSFVFGEMEIATPVIFDIGVYIAVVGVTLTIVLELMEED